MEKKIQKILLEIFRESSVPGWDGYNAAPITKKTYENSLNFIKNLPFKFSLPDICAEADGSICFDWFKNKKNQISLSIKNSEISYAARKGRKELYGSFLFHNI